MYDYSKFKRKDQNQECLNQIKPQRLRSEEKIQRKKTKYKLFHYAPPPFKILREKCLSKARKELEKKIKERKGKCVQTELVKGPSRRLI